MRVHYRKGSLLELQRRLFGRRALGPAKPSSTPYAEHSQRDASTYLDYGFTRPNVISRGPNAQATDQFAPTINQPTPDDSAPYYEGPSLEESTPLPEAPNKNEAPKNEIIPTPSGIEVTSAQTETLNPFAPFASLPVVQPALAQTPVRGPQSWLRFPQRFPAVVEPLAYKQHRTP